MVTLTYLQRFGLICNIVEDCQDGMDERYCEDRTGTMLRSGFIVHSNQVCNDRCDHSTCEDEANCHGVTVGLYCKYTYSWGSVILNNYVPPHRICTNKADCDGGEDEMNCRVTKTTEHTCTHMYAKREVPVHNYTQCGALGLGGLDQENSDLFIEDPNRYYVDGDLKKYQSNCSGHGTRVGGTCFIDGYLSTVSKYVICYRPDVSICDDNIEKECLNPSITCVNIHKHVMCDHVIDCEDISDELNPICHSRTERTCQRKVGAVGELTLPLAWLGDGTQDCLDGSDELVIWPFCGMDFFFLFFSEPAFCQPSRSEALQKG